MGKFMSYEHTWVPYISFYLNFNWKAPVIIERKEKFGSRSPQLPSVTDENLFVNQKSYGPVTTYKFERGA
jgi:hypothetical protein